MTSQLRLYNAALNLCGETTLADLAEARSARYILDEIWANGAVLACLEQGQWNFGIRASQLDYDPSIDPQFANGGYQYAFIVPDDWVRWTNICLDPYYLTALEQYQTDNNHLVCDWQTLYVRYVSSDADYGMDMSLWPQTFCRFVESYLAFHASVQMNQSDAKQVKLEAWMKKKLVDAGAKDAQQEPEKERPPGKWAMSRRWARPRGF